MPGRPSRRTFVLLVALVAAVAIVFLVRATMWPGDEGLVGSTETAVRARYGEPEHEFAGPYGNPTRVWTQQFKGEVKSEVFWRLGGHVYVTFEKRNGQWIVISNSYLPRGAVF